MYHKKLLNILPEFAIINESFKCNTKGVILNGTLGNEYQINCGVPRDRVLGPIFFILYTNKLYNMETEGSIVTYADDMCILFSNNT